MGIGKFFGKKKAVAEANLAKMENRDGMQAAIGFMILIAGADDQKLDDNEMNSIESVSRALPSLEHFGAEITTTINKYKGMLTAGYLIARSQIMREILEVKHDPQAAENAFVAGLTVAGGDGEYSEAEKRVILEVGNALGLRAESYGIKL